MAYHLEYRLSDALSEGQRLGGATIERSVRPSAVARHDAGTAFPDAPQATRPGPSADASPSPRVASADCDADVAAVTSPAQVAKQELDRHVLRMTIGGAVSA